MQKKIRKLDIKSYIFAAVRLFAPIACRRLTPLPDPGEHRPVVRVALALRLDVARPVGFAAGTFAAGVEAVFFGFIRRPVRELGNVAVGDVVLGVTGHGLGGCGD